MKTEIFFYRYYYTAMWHTTTGSDIDIQKIQRVVENTHDDIILSCFILHIFLSLALCPSAERKFISKSFSKKSFHALQLQFRGTMNSEKLKWHTLQYLILIWTLNEWASETREREILLGKWSRCYDFMEII